MSVMLQVESQYDNYAHYPHYSSECPLIKGFVKMGHAERSEASLPH